MVLLHRSPGFFLADNPNLTQSTLHFHWRCWLDKVSGLTSNTPDPLLHKESLNQH
jgi:hypothetical protein